MRAVELEHCGYAVGLDNIKMISPVVLKRESPRSKKAFASFRIDYFLEEKQVEFRYDGPDCEQKATNDRNAIISALNK